MNADSRHIATTVAGSLEQTTDYYPYGLPHATAEYLSDRNRRLYSAKELTTEAGLNAYDFAARWLSPAFPRFSSPDPLAEKYTPIGVYTFCGGDPVNYIDPTGAIIDLSNLSKEQLEIWNSTIALLSASSLFSAMYSILVESERTYTILEGNPAEISHENSTACFAEGVDGGIIYLSSNFWAIGDPNNNQIEELFHAFQSETTYDKGEINKELEASMFVSAVSSQSVGPKTSSECSVIMRFNDQIMKENEDHILDFKNSLIDPLTQESFRWATEIFKIFHKNKGTKSANYYKDSKGVPSALIRLRNLTK